MGGPAYLESIAQHCDDPTCLRRATVALYNGVNALIGWYCDQHGKVALACRREMEAKA